MGLSTLDIIRATIKVIFAPESRETTHSHAFSAGIWKSHQTYENKICPLLSCERPMPFPQNGVFSFKLPTEACLFFQWHSFSYI